MINEQQSNFGEKEEFIIFNNVIMNLQHVTNRGGFPAINVDFGQHGSGRHFANKATIQLNKDEFTELLFVLAGKQAEFQVGHHGQNKDKFLIGKWQNDGTMFISLYQNKQQLYYMSLNAAQVFRGKILVLKQLANALNIDLATANSLL